MLCADESSVVMLSSSIPATGCAGRPSLRDSKKPGSEGRAPRRPSTVDGPAERYPLATPEWPFRTGGFAISTAPVAATGSTSSAAIAGS